jgi:membrane associated rhomboid family serine protease
VDVEARLLLYTVVLGAVVVLFQLLHGRAFAFRVYMLELALLLAVAAAGIARPSWTRSVAWPAFGAFVAVALVPSALIESARRAALARRYGLAWTSATTGAALIGLPAPLRREAGLYGAMAAAEKGDGAACRRRLERIARTVGIPPELGGDALVRVLPAAAARRWPDALAAIEAAPIRAAPLLAIEVRAAADTGDLPRALRACQDIETLGRAGSGARWSARRCLLAASGRASSIAEAAARRLPLAVGPAGTVEASIARAYEASGDAARAGEAYAAARLVARGGVLRDAEEGARRCAAGVPLVAEPSTIEAAILDIERMSLAEASVPEPVPFYLRAPFTYGAVAVTFVVSAAVLLFAGAGPLAAVSCGALSAPLVAVEHEWWRLATTMLLHGGWVHLLMNLAAIVFVGVPLEKRLGAAAASIVYVGSGLVASAASAFLQQTDIGVGASGAAMGLIGALAMMLLRRPGLFAAYERRRWLSALALTVVATTLVGLAESGNVDNAAHGAGLAAGAVIGWTLLPVGAATRRRRSLLRVAACGAALAMALSAGAAASRITEWTGTRTVTVRGARAEVPAWMRERAAGEDSVVVSRAPLRLAAQIGSDPALPSPNLLVPPREELRSLLAAKPARTGSEDLGGGLACEWADFVDEAGAGFRVRSFRRGRAFAVVLSPIGPDADPDDESAALRLGRSLAAVD